MIYMFLADGFEQIEALATLDIMRRASIQVKTVSVSSSLEVKSTLDVFVKADMTADEIKLDQSFEGLVLPGGMPGAKNLLASPAVAKAIEYADKKHLLISAICASPFILGRAGVLKGKMATCYPGFEDELKGADVKPDYVVSDDNIITGKGAGASLQFGLAIVTYLKGAETAKKTAENMQCPN